MKKNLILPLIALTGFFASCDDNTDEVGFSLTSPTDRLTVGYGTFYINSETVKLDNIISRSSTGYLGKIKDPETGSYISADFMTQFSTLESEQESLFPPEVILFGEVDDHTEQTMADS